MPMKRAGSNERRPRERSIGGQWFAGLIRLLMALAAVGGYLVLADTSPASAANTPTIASITPLQGAQGTIVTVTGTNFDVTPGNVTAYFAPPGTSSGNYSSYAATSVYCPTTTSCELVTPAEPSPNPTNGIVDVLVAVDGTVVPTSVTDQFTYTNAISVDGIQEGQFSSTGSDCSCYQGDVTPSIGQGNTLASCLFDPPSGGCDPLTFPSDSDESKTYNDPDDSPVGNTPCTQLNPATGYPAQCPAAISYGWYVYELSPNDSNGLKTGDTVTLNAPTGTQWPGSTTNPGGAANYVVAPYCGYEKQSASGQANNYLCFNTGGQSAALATGVIVGSTGNTVQITMPMSIPQGQEFGIYIDQVVNPPEGNYSAGDYAVLTSETGPSLFGIGGSNIELSGNNNGEPPTCPSPSFVLCFGAGAPSQDFSSLTATPSPPEGVSTDSSTGASVTATIRDE
jgi:hypothetical protein